MKKHIIWLLFFGTLWGMSEVVLGKALYDAQVPYASAWLGAIALLLLGAARSMVNLAGASLAIGALASLFRAANAAPFFCHILGILFLAASFDLFATFLLRRDKHRVLMASLTGISSGLLGNILFSLCAVLLINQPSWTANGWEKAFDHVFVTGGVIAFCGAILVPLGRQWRGGFIQPRLAYGVIALAWFLGLFVL